MSASEPQVSREDWAQSDVHKASRYACGWCGQKFEMPHDFYDHLDTAHPKKRAKKEAKNGRDR